MNIPENNTDKKVFDVMLNQLKKVFDILDKYEVLKTEIQENKKITPHISYQITFLSNQLERTLVIGLVDYYSHISLTFEIKNLHKGRYYTLTISDYLKKHCNIKNSRDILSVVLSSNSDLDSQLESLLLNLKFKLDKQFFNILEGRDWVDIPFDWDNYK